MSKSIYDDTPVDEIPALHRQAYATFLSGKTRSIEYRKRQIKQLGFLIQDNEQQFCRALEQDFGRPAFETITGELNPAKQEIQEVYNHLDKWAKPVRVKTSFAWKGVKPTVYQEPKGVVLVIGTWNYPVTLLLIPLLGAIAAGCTALVKPAEQAPHTAALIAHLLPQYLDSSAYLPVLGAIDQATAVLKLKFDHIFYTGSGGIAKIIARAAAEHLTPLTLELGGKSPAVVFDDADIDTIARRIVWAKYTNAGQICISVDYVLVTPATEPKLIAAMQRALDSFKADPSAPLTTNADYSRVINDRHYQRLSSLLDKTRGQIAFGGKRDDHERKIDVTVVTGVQADDALMSEEIFGPILPVVTLPDKDAMIRFIQERETPLALYVFSQSNKNAQYVRERTRSGGFVHNDVLVHFMIPGLPFGGTGAAGYGNYHGKRTFDTFSHERASASVPTWMDTLLAARYPPYTAKKLKMLLFATGVVIKRPTSSGLAAVWGKVWKLLVAVAAVAAIRSRL
ncbi:aldehyde dehydrogenase [Rhodotorula sp. JG-1b]|nr:aldehyde dehydrogenase [Rhodotorula sp. JG-1b]